MKGRKIKVCYINGTHWDREWYEPFQEYRAWLVQTIDEAINTLEKQPELRCFHLDGQTVLLEDYLEIRPEQRERLLRLLRSGRMLAGPWYCLPDEFLVSGEAFIRNITRGMRILRDFAVEPMRDGYCPDMFGHIASLPMILAGFGFRHAALWRGIEETDVGSHFIWRGPDGSEVLTTKIADNSGYGWFSNIIRKLYDAGKRDEAVKAFKDFLANQKPRLRLPFLYTSDAVDHQGVFADAARFLDRLAKAMPEVEIVQTTIPEYVREIIAAAKKHKLAIYKGELHNPSVLFDTAYHWLIAHCISARYPLKRENDRCQNWLELVAEPAAAFALMSGKPLAPGYLRLAWRYLLRNQPHDSICGCSIDAAHADMPYRFKQSLELGGTVFRQAVSTFARPTADLKDGWQTIAVHNTLPWARHEIVELDLLLPSNLLPKEETLLGTHDYRSQFKLLLNGMPVDYQVLAINLERRMKQITEKGRRQTVGTCEVCRVAANLALPPAGCAVLRLEPLVGKHHRDVGTLRTAPLCAQNKHIACKILPSGIVALTHLKTRRTFQDLFLYEDGGDSGHGWIYETPVSDRKIISSGRNTVSVEQDGPLCVIFRIDRQLEIPAQQSIRPGESRGEETVILPVSDHLILTADAPYLRVRTTVRNTARDHRLRVLFPSGIKADKYWADEPFVFINRPVAIRKETLAGKEADPVERPHHSMFGIEDAKGGLAVLTPYGLHEHSVLDDTDRTLALTLFRSFRRTVLMNGEPGGQLLEKLEFEYLLYPYGGRFDRVSALRMLAGVRAQPLAHIAHSDTKATSFLKVEGDVHVSAVKPAFDEEGIIIRLWNPGAKSVSAKIRFAKIVKAAHLTDLNEDQEDKLSVKGKNNIVVPVPPFALRTVLAEF